MKGLSKIKVERPTIVAGPITWREPALPNGQSRWRIPPYGFLDTIELVLAEPLPNMDASSHIEVQGTLSIDGKMIAFAHCFALSRSIDPQDISEKLR